MNKLKYFLLLLSLPLVMSASDKISIGTIVYDWKNVEKAFEQLKDNGFNCCQLSYSQSMDSEFAARVKKAAKKNKIQITTLVGVPSAPGKKNLWNFIDGPCTIGLVPPYGRAEKFNIYKKMIDFCKEADIPAMHSHFGFIPEDDASSPNYVDFIDTMKVLAKYAEKKKVLIYFETGQETPITLLRALHNIESDVCFINLDVANLILYGKANPVDAIKQFGGAIKDVHAKDGKWPSARTPSKLGQETKIPRGDVDFPRVIQELKNIDYKGTITIECELKGDNLDYLVKTREYLEKLWADTKPEFKGRRLPAKKK